MSLGRKITQKEKDLLIIGLQMRMNYIQTGDMSLSANDLGKIGKENWSPGVKILPLSIEQMRIIIEMEELKKKISSNKIIIVN